MGHVDWVNCLCCLFTMGDNIVILRFFTGSEYLCFAVSEICVPSVSICILFVNVGVSYICPNLGAR